MTETPLPQRDLAATGAILTGVTFFALVLLGLAGVENRSAALLWALGCTTTGFIAGFLFGFPRVVSDNDSAGGGTQDPSTPAGSAVTKATAFAHRLAVNTNLEQISDWLTKIIVGVGLVELKNLPSYVARAGRYFGQGLGPEASTVFNERVAAIALVAFGGLGLLGGYLLTRMFFSVAFRRADEHALGLSSETKRALEETPLEEEGTKVALPPSAKAQAASVLNSPEAAGNSAEGQATWARVQFDEGNYEGAIEGYRKAVKLAPANPRFRYSYAVALKYGRRPAAEYMKELDEARQLAKESNDPDVRRQIYQSFTFNALYVPPPGGYQTARAGALEYTSRADNPPSGDVFLNLACAYGQQVTHEGLQPETPGYEEVRKRALEALEAALLADPRLRPRVQQLLEGRSPGDDDLEPFSKDPEFRRIAGL